MSSIKPVLHQIFSIVTLVWWFFVALYHTISYSQHKKKLTQPQRSGKQSIYLSFLLIFLAMLDLLTLIVETYDPIQRKAFCLIIQHGGTISYALFKCTTYLTLIMRSYESFNESILEYKTKYLLYLSSVLIAWTLCNIVIGLLLIDSTVDTQSVPVCVISFPWFLPVSWGLCDVFSIVCCSYLFIKPIFKLRAQMKMNKASDDTLALKYVALKQCVLSSIACFTTILALVIMGTLQMAPIAIGIDLNVTIICIILMYKWNKYIIYFCCPHCREHLTTKNLELTVSKAVGGQQPVPSKTSQTKEQSDE